MDSMSWQKNVSNGGFVKRTVRSELGRSNVASHPIHVYGRSRAPRLSTRFGCLAGARLVLLEVLVTPKFVVLSFVPCEDEAVTGTWGRTILPIAELGPYGWWEAT